MPILPENKHRYPANWKTEIRPDILRRAENRCEKCGVKNHVSILRTKQSSQWVYDDGHLMEVSAFKHRYFDWRSVYIVLTIAHLDHTPENCGPSNLRAWCQKCHNTHDAAHRAANRRKRKQLDLPTVNLCTPCVPC